MEIGKKYLIIYDDKGFKPMKKTGKIVSIDGKLIELDSGEFLNKDYIIRAQILEGGSNGQNT